MKKAGSSNSKSKTPPTSKSSELSDLAESMVQGHQPRGTLTPSDASLFRAFQSNLLSLLSHELNTPLMGVLNALTLLEQPSEPASEQSSEIPKTELIVMARRNAHRLQRALAALLDLAALESGTFHARLKEIELGRLISSKLEQFERVIKDQGLILEMRDEKDDAALAARQGSPLLADPQKLGRAIDLCLEVISRQSEKNTRLLLRISSARCSFQFKLRNEAAQDWREQWSLGVAGYQGGVAAPGSLFAGTLQTEVAFLTRTEEGLGSEFLLIHEIMRLHQGRFEAEVDPSGLVTLLLILPELSSEEGLQAVLLSRASQAATGMSSVALGLIVVPEGTPVHEFRAQVSKNLFRSTDAVYSLPARRRLALVIDDCKPQDAPKLLKRIEKAMGISLKYGMSFCPSDGIDPLLLVELAERRLEAPPAV